MEHGSAAAAAAQHGNFVPVTKLKMHFRRDSVGVADHHEILIGVPKPQYFVAISSLAQIQQGFVAGQILRRRAQSEIAIVHRKA